MMPPASRPTLAAQRDATGRAHDAAGRFMRTSDPAPHITARRTEVARLYPEKTCAEIGAELGWAAPTIWQDVKALGLDRRRPGARRKYPEPEERACVGCGSLFTPPSWAPDQRFHSIPCARATPTERVRHRARELRTEWRRRAEAEIAKLNAAGFLTAHQFAAERKVTESTVSQWIARGLLKAERRVIAREPHRIIAPEERERFNAEEWPRICKRMGPGFPENWGGERRRTWSRRLRAPLVGQLGGHRPGYTDAQAQLVRQLKTKFPTLGRATLAHMVTEITKRPITEKQVRSILSNPHK